MKKALSILLAATLVLVLPATVLAVDDVTSGTGTGDTKTNVTATYKENTTGDIDTVYLVNVEWNVNSTLKYSDGETTYTWNAADTKYETGATTGDGWTGDATVGITVTNKSNAAISATASWAAAAPIEAECTFADNKNSVEIISAADGVTPADNAAGEAKTGTISATVATPTAGTISQNNAPVGTITVSIAPKN